MVALAYARAWFLALAGRTVTHPLVRNLPKVTVVE
jgi:hypothetical protein